MIQAHSRRSFLLAVAGSTAFLGAAEAGAQFHPTLSASERAVVDKLVEGILIRQAQNQQASAPSISTLLPSWRQPDVFSGAACMNCHSPDGFDLAMMGYTDENLLRRAIPHVGEEHAENILQLIHAIRDSYGMDTLIDPMEQSMLQPGGILLPGDTGPQRDQAFGNLIAGKLRLAHAPTSSSSGSKRRTLSSSADDYSLILMRGTVNSLSRAKQARDQLLNVNLHTTPIGIPMNRWTEDGFHGSEHALMADWIPDLPQIVGPSEAAGWMAAQDAYVNDPSNENFWNIHWKLNDNTIHNYFSGNADKLVEFKYRSMMIAQHIIRQRMLGNEILDGGAEPVFYDQLGNAANGKLPNPIWDLGAAAKSHTNSCPEFDGCLGLPHFVTDRLNQETMTMADHFIAIRLPWLWLGWTMDPAMQRAQHYPAAVRLLDLNRLAWEDGGGYPIHNAFAISRKLVTQSFVPESWNEYIDDRPQHLVVDLAGFTLYNKHINAEPTDLQHRNLYRKFTANCFMMFLYLMQDEMNQNGFVYDRAMWNKSLDEMELFFEHIGSSSGSLHMMMLNQVRNKMASLPDA